MSTVRQSTDERILKEKIVWDLDLEWTRVQFSDYTMHNIPLPRFSMVLIDSRHAQVIWS